MTAQYDMVLAEYITIMQKRYVRTTITLPRGLPQRARFVGINISSTATRAVLKEVEKAEQKAGEPVKATPAAAPGSQGAL